MENLKKSKNGFNRQIWKWSQPSAVDAGQRVALFDAAVRGAAELMVVLGLDALSPANVATSGGLHPAREARLERGQDEQQLEHDLVFRHRNFGDKKWGCGLTFWRVRFGDFTNSDQQTVS